MAGGTPPPRNFVALGPVSTAQCTHSCETLPVKRLKCVEGAKVKSNRNLSFRNGNSGTNSVQIIGTILVVTELQVMRRRIQTDEEENSN